MVRDTYLGSQGVSLKGGFDTATGLSMRAYVNGQHRWSSEPLQVGPGPRYQNAGTDSVDYCVMEWPQSGFIAVAGTSRLFLLNDKNGKVVAAFDLRFAGRTAIDVLEICPICSAQILLAASTKRVMLLDRKGRLLGDSEPSSIYCGPPEVIGDHIVLSELDVDNPDGMIRREVSIPGCIDVK